METKLRFGRGNAKLLDFGQIGLITLTFQLTSTLLQPLVGFYTDQKPKPFSLAIGMGVSLCGLLLLSQAWSFAVILLAAGLVGVGSSIFHPEATRLARFSSGGRHGLAQSVISSYYTFYLIDRFHFHSELADAAVPCFRYGRIRICSSRQPGGPDEHHFRLSCLLVSAVDRINRGVPAEPRCGSSSRPPPFGYPRFFC
jgi:hypothetical protein